MTIPIVSAHVPNTNIPRPKDVGVLAMEVYFPRRVRVEAATVTETFSDILCPQ